MASRAKTSSKTKPLAKPKHNIKAAAITRSGFEYQDLIGIEALILFFRHPDRYKWVSLESEESEAEYLDDVVVARADGLFEYTQVKFTVDPDVYLLNWDWLIDKVGSGTSLLEKWSSSLEGLASVYSAQLKTNRRPNDDFRSCLRGGFVDPDLIHSSYKDAVLKQLGGMAEAKAFFTRFKFDHSLLLTEALETRLKNALVPSNTTPSGWLLLRERARKWAINKKTPEPDGKILHQHLVQIITKQRPQPIPQNFEIPQHYGVPDEEFHKAFLERIQSENHPVTILWGTPGRGKSTYLSYIVDSLVRDRLPIVRHHYFLSLDDSTTDRISFPDIASSLMDQITARYQEAIEGLKEEPNNLRQWLEACGSYFSKNKKRFFVIIDGLDHVWRERMNIEQMEHLFSVLLPEIPNVNLVIGTQRVADQQLPLKLLQTAGNSDWVAIPPMNEGAVHNWVKNQARSGRLRLSGAFRSANDQDHESKSIGRAFFDICAGHPLHLIYSFESLVSRGIEVTEDAVRDLPVCPDGDIQKYYRGLWARFSPGARQILHLIAGSDFHWPSDGLRKCAHGPTDEIDHLLDYQSSGVLPFHGSILAYVREQSDHRSSFAALLPEIVKWLETEAPEYWRWGWLWLSKSQAGDSDDLLSLTTRDWIIQSLAKGWPARQVMQILATAEHIAFERSDFPRALELRSLRIRLANGPEFQTNEFSAFQEMAIKTADNAQQFLNLSDRLPQLSDDDVVTVARIARYRSDDIILGECMEELRRRVNIWIQLRHKPDHSFVPLSRHFVEACSLQPEIDAKRLIKFIRSFQSKDEFFRRLLGSLTRVRNLKAIRAIRLEIKTAKDPNWHTQVEDAIFRVSRLEGARLDSSSRSSEVGPTMACYLLLTNQACPPIVGALIPENVIREDYEYGPNTDLETFYHSVFFGTLAAQLRATGEFSPVVPGIDMSNLGWTAEAIEMLQSTAIAIGKEELDLSFATVFRETQTLRAVIDQHPSDAQSVQYRAFQASLRAIAIDLHFLATDEPVTGVTLGQFTEVRSSRHWVDDAWLMEELDHHWSILSTEAALAFLDNHRQKEATTVTEFNERMEKWLRLARFATLYGLDGASQLLLRSADCIIGYGWRKDPWIFDVLENVRQLAHAKVDGPREWIKRLTPIVEQITEFTDGDGSRHARTELIELIGVACPEYLPACYAHYIHRDKLHLAEEALITHAYIVEYDDLPNQALARTFVERRDVSTLRDLANQQRPGASESVKQQIEFLGSFSDEREPTSRSSPDDAEKTSLVANPREYKPDEFADLIAALSSEGFYLGRSEPLIEWLEHWKYEGKGDVALQSIKGYFDKTEKTYSAEGVLDTAFLVSLEIEGKTAAYPWLVLAHIHRRGWDSNWSSNKEIVNRLGRAADYYPDRWKEYIQDTSKPSAYWERKRYGHAMGNRYLVRFLLMVGQRDLAKEFTEKCVQLTEKEVSDQPIPKCEWML